MGKKNFIVSGVLILAILVGVGGYFWLKNQTPKISDPLLKKIHDRGTIIVGTDATFSPFESADKDGNFFGFDIDFAREIGKDLGVNVEFKNIGFDKLFDSLSQGEIDLITAGLTITSDRAATMSFSDPYFNAGQVIVTTKDNQSIKGVENLAGIKLAVQAETTGESEAKKLTDYSLVASFDNYDLARDALLKGDVGAIIVDYPAATELIKKNTGLKIIGEPFTQEFYGAAVNLKEGELLAQVNKTIRRLKEDGRLKELEDKWLNKSI